MWRLFKILSGILIAIYILFKKSNVYSLQLLDYLFDFWSQVIIISLLCKIVMGNGERLLILDKEKIIFSLNGIYILMLILRQ